MASSAARYAPASSDGWETVGERPSSVQRSHAARTRRTDLGMGGFSSFEPEAAIAAISKASMDVSDRARWQKGALAKLDHIAALETDWDSYGARPISSTVVAFVESLLELVAQPKVPEPAVVPTPDGGVQLEWHIRGLDLEVEVAPSATGALLVSLEDEWAHEAMDETLLPGSAQFFDLLHRLVARSEMREP